MAWLTYVTTYILIFLAELGDKTQVATLLLAGNNPGHRWGIWTASASALSSAVLLEVTAGAFIARCLPARVFNRATGVIFILLGLYGFSTWLRARRADQVEDVGGACRAADERGEPMNERTWLAGLDYGD